MLHVCETKCNEMKPQTLQALARAHTHIGNTHTHTNTIAVFLTRRRSNNTRGTLFWLSPIFVSRLVAWPRVDPDDRLYNVQAPESPSSPARISAAETNVTVRPSGLYVGVALSKLQRDGSACAACSGATKWARGPAPSLRTGGGAGSVGDARARVHMGGPEAAA